MFQLIARTIERRSWIIVAGWVVFTAVLYATAPKWETVTRDDDVSFFPAGSPSVEGQALLRRGFPRDVASSQACVIAERRDGLLRPTDYKFIDRLSAELSGLVESERALGIKQVLDHRAMVIGPRLVGTAPGGDSQATLTVVMLEGTYLAKRSRLAVERIADVVKKFGTPPEGLTLGITGSAAVGKDMNDARMRASPTRPRPRSRWWSSSCWSSIGPPCWP